MNVLLTCAGRRSYLVSWFREAVAPGGRVVATNSHADAAAMAVADRSYVAPVLDSDAYLCFILDVCRREDIGLLVPLFDLELPQLAEATERFAAIGVTVAVSSPEAVASCRDKLAVGEIMAARTNLRAPRTTLDPDEAAAWIDRGGRGVFIKPRYGTGSIATLSTTQPDEVAVLHRKVRRDVAATYLGEDDVVIQEALAGQEYGLTVVNDLAGRFRAVLANRKVAMRAGETDVAETVELPVLADAGRQLSAALGHVGALDVDVFVDGDRVTVLDLNARIGGNYPFSHLAGVDLPLAYVRWGEARDVDDEAFAVRPGVVGLKAIEPLISRRV